MEVAVVVEEVEAVADAPWLYVLLVFITRAIGWDWGRGGGCSSVQAERTL